MFNTTTLYSDCKSLSPPQPTVARLSIEFAIETLDFRWFPHHWSDIKQLGDEVETDHGRSSQSAWIVSLGQSLTIGRLMTFGLPELILSLASCTRFPNGQMVTNNYNKLLDMYWHVLTCVDMYWHILTITSQTHCKLSTLFRSKKSNHAEELIASWCLFAIQE